MSGVEAYKFDVDCRTGLPCQEGIIPIIPVRFSLNQTSLENTANDIKPILPTSVSELGGYQLRRLRQGYFYIYSKLGMNSNSTDGNKTNEGKWQIFQYYVSTEDSNSNTTGVSNTVIPSQEKVSLPYLFRKYRWEKGSKEKWVLEDKTYPFAFVHKDTTLIQYAYSEYRWPGEMFELLESNEAIRNSIMQPASLKPENSTYSFPFSQAENKVADFNPNAEQSKKDSQDSQKRYTAIGYSKRHQIMISDKETYNRARVVDVIDPAGDLADISCLHEYMWANMVKDQRKYIYATNTAASVMFLKKQFGFKRNWFKTLPYEEKNEKLLNEYADNDFLLKKYRSTLNQINNIAKVHKKLAEEEGKFTLAQQLNVVTSQAVKFAGQDAKRLNEVNEFAAFLAHSIMQGIGISTEGMKQQAEMLASNKPIGNYIGKILTIAQSVQKSYDTITTQSGLKRLALETLFENVMTAQIYRWTSTQFGSSTLTRAQYLSAFGLKRMRLRLDGNATVYGGILESQIKGFLKSKVEFTQSPALTNQLKYASVASENVRESFSVSVIVPDGQTDVSKFQQKLFISHKVGLFLACLSLADTYASLSKSENNTLGQVLLQSSAGLLGLVTTFYYQKNGLANKGILNVSKNVHGLLPRTFGGQELLVQRFGQVVEGSASSTSKFFVKLGHIANFLGIAATLVEVVKGWGKNDRANNISGVFFGLSQVALWVADASWIGATSGVLLCVVGVVFMVAAFVIYTFADNDFEAWVRSGFWGNSSEYWEEYRVKSISKQLSDAEILAFPNKSDYANKLTFYNKEMEAFHNLIWGLSIKNNVKGDKKLRVYCPAFIDGSSVRNLKVNWQQLNFWGGYNNERGQTSTPLDSSRIKKRWLFNGWIELDFSQIKATNQNVIPDFANKGRKLMMQTTLLRLEYPKLGQGNGNFVLEKHISANEI